MTCPAGLRTLHRTLAEYIDRVLEGARPTEMPVEQPSKFDPAINLKTSKALGLALSPWLCCAAR